MPWQNNPGGRGGGPWSQGPRPTGPNPPNLDDILKKGQDRMRGLFPGGLGGKGIALIVLVLVGLWAITGFYRVLPSEQGVVLIFGKWDGTLKAEGLHWTWPSPISEVETPNVTEIRQTQIGFTTTDSRGHEIPKRSIDSESLMLTGDKNIIDIEFAVFWQIKDAGAYLFNIQYPEDTVKAVAESAMREVIGKTDLEVALTSGQQQIAEETKALMQQILDSYKAGVQINQIQLSKPDTPGAVIESFRDVQAAGADREATIKKAEAYRNTVVPEARGEAAKIVQKAEGYKETVVARANGEASRFIAVYDQYKNAKEVTKQRIYLETMEDILSGVNKVLIDQKAGSGVVPYLPLPEIKKHTAASPSSQGDAK